MSTTAARPNHTQVDRRFGLSTRQFKKEYLYAGKPVVLTDLTDGWRARSAWTLDYFKSRYGNSVVPVYRLTGHRYRADDVEMMKLASFIQNVQNNDFAAYPCYVRDDAQLFNTHRELLADYKVPDYFFDWFKLLPSFMRLEYPTIFVGPKGAITPLHHDIWKTHSWLAQLVGRKRWILFSPDEKKFLYDYNVQPHNPDLKKFPLFLNTKPLECIIGPGDLIFVPSGWAHEVISLDATISITHNYMAPGCFGSALTSCVREKLIDRVKQQFAR
jgi:hypothetical protein